MATPKAKESTAKAPPKPTPRVRKPRVKAVPKPEETPPKPEGTPSKADLATVRHAIVQRWPIPPEVREETIAAARKILKNADSFGPREVVAAAKVIIAADAQNLAEEKLKVPQKIELSGSVKVEVYIPANGRDTTNP